MPEETEQGQDPTKVNVIDLLDDGPEPVPEPEPTDPTPEPEPEPVAVPVANDPAALATAFAEGLKQAGFVPPAASVKPEEKPLTPEDAKKLLNVMEIDDKFLEEFDNLDTRKAKLEAFRDGVIRQADTITQLRLNEFQKVIESRYAPVEQFVSTKEAEAREARFNTQFPDLAKPELVPLRDTIINGLAAQGVLKGKNEKEIFGLIAQSAEAVIKQANPDFKLSPAGSSPAGSKPASKTNPNALRATTSGAGGGGGGSKTDVSNPSKSKLVSLLD